MNCTPFFLPSFGNRPFELVERDDFVADFRNALLQPIGHPDRSILAIGRRGMGKTALLLEFSDIAMGLGYVVVRSTATESILDDIIGAIQLGIGNLKAKPAENSISAMVQGFSLGLVFSEEAYRQLSFQNKLVILIDELEKLDKGLVILVDEIQAHAVAVRLLTTAYQHLIGERKNVAIVMAGLPHAISAMVNDDALTFFNRAKKIWLTPLSQNAISAYYAKVFYKLGKVISDFNLELAVEMTHGYPYLVQLIGYYLLELVGESSEITASHIELANKKAKHVIAQNLQYQKYEII